MANAPQNNTVTVPTYASQAQGGGVNVYNPNTGALLSGAGNYNPNTGAALNQNNVNTTPSASDMSGTSPYYAPQYQNSGSTPFNSILSNTTAMAQSQSQLQAQAAQATKNAQDTYNSTAGAVQGLINQYSGQGADQAAMEQAAGTPQLQQAANSLNNQLLTQQATYNTQYNDILNRVGGTSQQKAQEIAALQQQHGYDLTNTGIQASIASTNYTNAETLIQHQIDLKYSNLKNTIDYGMQFLSQNKDQLSQATQNQLTTNLQVQQQTYDQGKFYSQLNASTGLQMIQDATANKAPQDVVDKMSQLISSGASAGEIAAAGGQYLSNGNYSYQFNPSTQQFSLINSKTGLAADGSPADGSQLTYNANDPSSQSIVTAPDGSTYNMQSYATDPQYGLKIQAATSTIQSSVGNITSAQSMQAAISSLSPQSKLTGASVYGAATSAGIDPTFFLAQIKQESLLGTSNVATSNNNFGGITYSGSAQQKAAGITAGTPRPEGGFYAKFPSAEAGLKYQANLVASSYKIAPPANSPGQTLTIQSSIQNVLAIKKSLPANISAGVGIINSTGNGYIDLSKVTDLPGYPSGSAKTQAESYAKQYGLAPLNSDQVTQVQDYDAAMTKVNNLQDSWNAVAPDGIASRSSEAITDPLAVKFDTQRGQALIKYNNNQAAAIGAFNSQTDSKTLKSFSYALAEASLPQVPGSGILSGLSFGALSSGDTLQDGNNKLDNIRKNLNASFTNIDPSLKPAPLSSDLPSIPVPKAGDIRMFGNIKVQYNADGSATVIK